MLKITGKKSKFYLKSLCQLMCTTARRIFKSYIDMEPLIMNFVLEMWLAIHCTAVCVKLDGTFTGVLNMVRMLKGVDMKLH
jgi:hypothetical protein